VRVLWQKNSRQLLQQMPLPCLQLLHKAVRKDRPELERHAKVPTVRQVHNVGTSLASPVPQGPAGPKKTC